MDIGYWVTVATLFVATFCLCVHAGGFWPAVVVMLIFCLPLTFIFLPLAAIGGWIGLVIALAFRHQSIRRIG